MKGGKRPNAGRKSISEELGTRDLARNAIIKRFGSLEEGLEALLKMNEQALTKFVFEHAMGKPKEDINLQLTDPIKSLLFEPASNKDK